MKKFMLLLAVLFTVPSVTAFAEPVKSEKPVPFYYEDDYKNVFREAMLPDFILGPESADNLSDWVQSDYSGELVWTFDIDPTNVGVDGVTKQELYLSKINNDFNLFVKNEKNEPENVHFNKNPKKDDINYIADIMSDKSNKKIQTVKIPLTDLLIITPDDYKEYLPENLLLNPEKADGIENWQKGDFSKPISWQYINTADSKSEVLFLLKDNEGYLTLSLNDNPKNSEPVSLEKESAPTSDNENYILKIIKENNPEITIEVQRNYIVELIDTDETDTTDSIVDDSKENGDMTDKIDKTEKDADTDTTDSETQNPNDSDKSGGGFFFIGFIFLIIASAISLLLNLFLIFIKGRS